MPHYPPLRPRDSTVPPPEPPLSQTGPTSPLGNKGRKRLTDRVSPFVIRALPDLEVHVAAVAVDTLAQHLRLEPELRLDRVVVDAVERLQQHRRSRRRWRGCLSSSVTIG